MRNPVSFVLRNAADAVKLALLDICPHCKVRAVILKRLGAKIGKNVCVDKVLLNNFRGNLARAASKPRFLMEFLGLGRGRAELDELSLRDPLPFLVLFADSLYRFLKGGGHLATHDSLQGEWT